MDLVNYISKLNTNVFALRNDDDLADRYVKFIFNFFLLFWCFLHQEICIIVCNINQICLIPIKLF